MPSLCRGQCEDQRRRPVCLRGVGGEDPADSGPVGEREPGSEDPVGRTATGRRQSLRGLLLHTLKSPRWNPKDAPNLRENDYGLESSEEETERVEEEEEASSLEEFCGSE